MFLQSYKFVFIVVLSGLFMTSCSKRTWKNYTDIKLNDSKSGIIYIYNACSDRGVVGAGTDLYIDGKWRALINQGAYYGTNVKAGLHKVSFKSNFLMKHTINVNVQKGKASYIEISWPMLDKYKTAKVAVRPVSREIGKARIIKCKRAKKGEFTNEDAK